MPVENANTPAAELGPGELYLLLPDGGHPIELGRVTETTLTEERTDYRDELGEPAPVVATPAKSVTFECTVNPETISLISLWRLTHDIRVVLVWAQENRPKLLHLATYANTCRKRRKNITRILREFFWEVQHETQRS